MAGTQGQYNTRNKRPYAQPYLQVVNPTHTHKQQTAYAVANKYFMIGRVVKKVVHI